MTQKQMPRMRSARERKALVIEDDHIARRSVARVIRSAGFDVTDAVNVRKGLDIWEKSRAEGYPFDLVCTDYDTSVSPGNGGLTGLDVVQRTVEASVDQFTIVLTGQADKLESGLRQRLLDAGADVVLSKPVDGRDMVSIIKAHFKE